MQFLWVRLALWELNESSKCYNSPSLYFLSAHVCVRVSAGWRGSGTRVRWPVAGVFRWGEWSVCLTTRQDHDWLRIPSVLLTHPDRSTNRTVTCRNVLNTECPAGARYINYTLWKIMKNSDKIWRTSFVWISHNLSTLKLKLTF